jgi:hypothetical protein
MRHKRAGRILYAALVLLGGAGFVLWVVVHPGIRFDQHDEDLFRAARHAMSPASSARWRPARR